MGDATSTRAKGGIDGKRFVLSLAAAGLAVALLSWFDDLIAVPLREVSSMISAVILEALSFSVTRTGTILTIGEMRFDVVPACCGSNTLQAMIAVGVVWCFLHPRLKTIHGIAASLLCVPVAIAANGIRVAVLAGTSYFAGAPIESGLLHHGTGVLAFAVCLGGFFFLTEHFPQAGPRRKVTWPELSLRLTAGLLVVIFLPFLVKCIGDWKGNIYNRLDLHGYCFFFAGLAAFVLYWRRRPGSYGLAGPGSVLFAAALLPLVFTFVQTPNHYVVGASLLLALFSLALVFRGFLFALSALPLLIVIGLGYPKTTAVVNTLFGQEGIAFALALKIVTSVVLMAATGVTARWVPVAKGGPARLRSPFLVVAGLTGCVFVVQLLNITIEADAGKIPIVLSYLQEDWVGEDRPLGEREIDFFRDQNVLNRVYTRGEDRVGILIISSSGERKKIHPPEYCQTGAGWTIAGKDRVTLRKGGTRETGATRLQLHRGETGVRRSFVYWFSDGETDFPDYPSLVLSDTMKMLSSQPSDWYLYALWTDQEEELLEDFLGVMKGADGERCSASPGTPPALVVGGL